MPPANQPDPAKITRQAMQVLQELADRFNPRPAGGQAEENLRSWIEARLHQSGYTTERIPVAFAPPSPDTLPYFIVATLIAASLGFGYGIDWLVLPLPFVGAILLEVVRRMLGHRPRKLISQNLFARPAQGKRYPTGLLIVAHTDSAPASLLTNPLLLRARNLLLDIYQRVAIGLALLGLVSLLGLALLPGLRWLVAGLGIVTGVVISAIAYGSQPRGSYAPGINDNASGCALILALAEHYAQHPPELELAFLFTTAEETGLHGAEAFTHYYPHMGERFAVLNIDMIGRGDILGIVRRDGMLEARRTDASLNNLLETAGVPVDSLWLTVHSSDHLAFLRAGWQAACIQVTGSDAQAWRAHSSLDTLDAIQPEAIMLAAKAAIAVIDGLDKSRGLSHSPHN